MTTGGWPYDPGSGTELDRDGERPGTLSEAIEQASTLPELVDACDEQQRAVLQSLCAAYIRTRLWALRDPERRRGVLHEITYGCAPEVCPSCREGGHVR